MMENLVPVFIAVTAAAVVLQAGILVALYVGVRKTTAKLEATVRRSKGQGRSNHRVGALDADGVTSQGRTDRRYDGRVASQGRFRLWTRRSSLRPKVQAVFDNLGRNHCHGAL